MDRAILLNRHAHSIVDLWQDTAFVYLYADNYLPQSVVQILIIPQSFPESFRSVCLPLRFVTENAWRRRKSSCEAGSDSMCPGEILSSLNIFIRNRAEGAAFVSPV